jgi:hypothetical protein
MSRKRRLTFRRPSLSGSSFLPLVMRELASALRRVVAGLEFSRACQLAFAGLVERVNSIPPQCPRIYSSGKGKLSSKL